LTSTRRKKGQGRKHAQGAAFDSPAETEAYRRWEKGASGQTPLDRQEGKKKGKLGEKGRDHREKSLYGGGYTRKKIRHWEKGTWPNT